MASNNQDLGYIGQLLTVDKTSNTVTVTGTMSANNFDSLSDVSLKTNISTVDNPLEKVNLLRGVNFTWKANNTISMGVVAQEVEQVLPELVTSTDLKRVNYDGFVGVLIESIKELKTRVDQLQTEIDSLKNNHN